MTDIAATDVTYSFDAKDAQYMGKLGKRVFGSLTFGNGSLTYKSGGVPITKAKMGLPTRIRSLNVIETNAKGLLCEYDVSAETLRLFWATPSGSVAAPTISLANAGANAAANAAIWANGTVLSQGNATATGITGVQAPAFTGTAAVLTELTGGSSAIPTTVVCQVEAIGY